LTSSPLEVTAFPFSESFLKRQEFASDIAIWRSWVMRRHELTPGQRHEATVADSLLEHAQGGAFIGDTGYDSAHIRETVKACGMKPVIPPNGCRTEQYRYDKRLYRIRYRVECFFHNLKRCRRIATRYEKTGATTSRSCTSPRRWSGCRSGTGAALIADTCGQLCRHALDGGRSRLSSLPIRRKRLAASRKEERAGDDAPRQLGTPPSSSS
jgi:transposase